MVWYLYRASEASEMCAAAGRDILSRVKLTQAIVSPASWFINY
jgi:hypothetical protein